MAELGRAGPTLPGSWSGRRLAARLIGDGPLLAAILAITAFGIAVIYSASGEDVARTVGHGVRLIIAVAAMLVVAQIHPLRLRLWTPWIYFGGVALLVAVPLVGESVQGARRWLDLGVVTVQPSELMKVAVPLMAARYLHNCEVPPSLPQTAGVIALIGVPVALVANQPDLGTSLLIGAAGFFTLFLAGLSWRLLGVFTVAASLAAPLVWMNLHAYQRQRVITFLNPEADPLGAGYHTIQSKIALGSGGLFGKGWLNGSQSHLEFLPERSTDFVFAVIGEEFGLFGVVLLLAGYLFIIGRGMLIAMRADDTFQRLLAGAVSLTFFVYVFVNTGMVAGLLPVVGVPLPLISFGGTAMVTLLVGFGIILSIHNHRETVP